MKCGVVYSGEWGDGPALALVFQIADGRITQESCFPGVSAVEGLFELLGARVVQDLVGVCLRVIVSDDASPEPEVIEVLTSGYVAVPNVFRHAFDDDDGRLEPPD